MLCNDIQFQDGVVLGGFRILAIPVPRYWIALISPLPCLVGMLEVHCFVELGNIRHVFADCQVVLKRITLGVRLYLIRVVCRLYGYLYIHEMSCMLLKFLL